MKKLPILTPGDSIEIIAPASRCSTQQLNGIIALVKSWQLNCLVADDIFGDDLLCANNDKIRLKNLINALQNTDTKAIIIARGGYGSTCLVPELKKISPPEFPKIFVGMSDTTAIQLYLQQQWQWPTIHGAISPDRFSQESIASVKSILFGDVSLVAFSGLLPLNKAAEMKNDIEATMIGGNLSIVQAGIGTVWQMDGRGKIIFLEETGERGYRIDRMLEHLHQANIFNNAAGIIFGDFLGGDEPNGSSTIKPVLNRFAERCEIPVVQIQGCGHGEVNFPIPLGTLAKLQLGSDIKLICSR